MAHIKKPGINKILLRTLLLFSPFFILSVVTLLFFLSIYIKLDMQNISRSQKLILELQKKKMGNSFNEIFADIKFLADTDIVKNYCSGAHDHKSELQELLYYFIKNKRVYDQIRILDAEGMEAVRLNYNNGYPEYAHEDRLQDKSDRYYFQSAKDLSPNTVYISPIDLNQEFGHIELPEKPMISFVLPLRNANGANTSYLVFNYNAKQLLDGIRDHESISYGLIMLLNKESQWLVSSDRSQEMAFVKGDATGFKDKYPEIWQQMYLTEQGNLSNPDGYFYYTTLRPVPTLASENSDTIDLTLSTELKYKPASYEWKLVTYVPQYYLELRYDQVSNFAYIVFAMVNFAFLTASFAIAFIRINARYKDAVYKNMLEEYVEELKRKRGELQKQVTETQELVHILCHDLVNPIGCATGMLEIYYNEPEEEYREIVDESLEQAMDIVNLVRTMRAIESGKKQFTLEPVNLHNAMKKSKMLLNQRFIDKDIKLNVDVDESLNVMADPASLINSVINNLLTNALKFSYSGSSVDVSAEKHGDKVIMTVRDYGKGMPDIIAENIFNPVKPTSRHGTDGETGTGFGLPLVYKFVNVYGGTIRVESVEQKDDSVNHGTAMILTFNSAD
jgi:signal transduction histidine kinase